MMRRRIFEGVEEKAGYIAASNCPTHWFAK
jgi:hypothetical protein